MENTLEHFLATADLEGLNDLWMFVSGEMLKGKESHRYEYLPALRLIEGAIRRARAQRENDWLVLSIPRR